MEARKKFSFTAKRFLRFLGLMVRNGKALMGLSIIMFFVVLALFASFLTPFTSLGKDAETRQPPAPKYCVPSWYRTVLQNPTLTDNLRVVEDPGLPKLKSEGGEWLLLTESDRISVNTDESVGFPFDVAITQYEIKDGSLAVQFNRAPGTIYNESKVSLVKEFNYPFGGVPNGFSGNLELLVEGSTHKIGEHEYLDVLVNVRFFIALEGGNQWTLWPPPLTDDVIGHSGLDALIGFNIINYTTGEIYTALEAYPKIFEGEIFTIENTVIAKPESGAEENANWVICKPSRSTGKSYIDNSVLTGYCMGLTLMEDPAGFIFEETPGNYSFGVELTFIDVGDSDKSVETTVHIDDINLNFYGNSYGILGTDHEGNDLFAQLIHGTRISLYLGLSVSIMTVVLGLSVGLAAGYLGGIPDQILMRFNDLMLCLPTLPLLIVLAAVLGTTIENLMLLLVLLGWNGFARVVRSMAISLKERPFVEAAKAVGAGSGHVILRHIIPNVMPIVYVSLATSVPGAITAEASLSWLGFFDATRMSWGRMLFNISHIGGTAQVAVNPWWVIVPGLFISMMAVAFILVGYALDEILNPRLRMRR